MNDHALRAYALLRADAEEKLEMSLNTTGAMFSRRNLERRGKDTALPSDRLFAAEVVDAIVAAVNAYDLTIGACDKVLGEVVDRSVFGEGPRPA